MAASAKKKNGWMRLLTTLLSLAALFYIGYQVYRSVFSNVQTEMAVNYSVYESVEVEGMVFRTETMIPPPGNGYVYYTVENGTRVAKGGVIASVYPTAGDGLLEQQIAEIDKQIEALRTIQTDDSSKRVTLDVINTQLGSTVDDIIRYASDGVFDPTEESYKLRMLSFLSKKQMILGEELDFSQPLAQLTEARKELASRYHKAISSVTAPVAGYFADKTDGYETALSKVDPTKLSVEQMKECLATEPSGDTAGGKIVGGYEWYFGCVMPDSYYNAMTVGRTMSLRMSFVTEDEIPVTVVACNKDNQGSLAVVFRSANMSEALSTIRKETVQVQMVRHTGLRVPKRAIIIVDGQAGVYVRSGNTVAFRKIDQQFSEPADYVICKEHDESGYLRMYDDIIVGGRGLYDGKIIR